MALVDLSTIKGAKQVPDYPGYWVSPDGRVFSTKNRGTTTACRTDNKARELKTPNNASGYRRLSIRTNENATRQSSHTCA